ncbi:MAG: hypothetical protein JSU92_11470, partial [Deltaproteobacteria bacterium]
MERKKVSSLVLGSAALSLSVIGGHPESTFYAFLLSGVWFVFRLLFYKINNFSEKTKIYCCLLGGAIILGSLLSVIQVLPFVQHLRRSWNYHSAFSLGIHLKIKFLITLLLPWFYGNSLNSLVDTFNFVPYSGIITVTLALVTLIKIRSVNRYGVFFAGSFIFFWGLAYGLPGFDLVDSLPIFNRIFYYFRGPVTPACFSIAVMAGMGLNYLVKKRYSVKAFYFAMAIIFLFIIVISIFHLTGLFLPLNLNYLKFQVGLSFLLLSLLFFLFRWYNKKKIQSYFFGILMIILTSSALWIDNLGNKTLYKEVTEEQLNARLFDYFKTDKMIFRFHVFPPSLLTPNVGLLYSFNDIRISDPLIEKKQFYLLNFINETSEMESAINFLYLPCIGPRQSKLFSPILDLINLKYVVSKYGLLSYQILDDILRKAKIVTIDKRYFGLQKVKEMPEVRDVLYQHPPTIIEFPLKIPEEGAFLNLAIEMGLNSWLPEKGDGVGFALDVNTGSKMEKIFFRYIDPKRNELDRKQRWLKVNLHSYRGKEVIMRLITDPGPRGDEIFDWADWWE